MLLKFEFENYKSFRENNVISMNNKKSCLIVGEKISGKTNAIEALICCISHIISPIQFIHREEIKMYKKCIPFFYGSMNEKYCTKFKIEVKLNKDIYEYSMSIKNKLGLISIEQESLTFNKLKMYNRKKEKIEVCENFKVLAHSTNIDNGMPYISYLSITEKNEIINRLIKYLKDIIFIDTSLNSYISNIYIEKCLLDNKNLFLKILRNINRNFKDYYLNKDKKIVNVYQINDRIVEINLMEDSFTIQQLFIFLPQILNSIKEGKLIIIDDIDKKIDKGTLTKIINIFNDKQANKNNSQLIASLTKNNNTESNENIIFTTKEGELNTRLLS